MSEPGSESYKSLTFFNAAFTHLDVHWGTLSSFAGRWEAGMKSKGVENRRIRIG